MESWKEGLRVVADERLEHAPRERRTIVYTNEGDQWSVLDRECGIAMIEVGNEEGQAAFDNHDGEAMVEAADNAGTCYPFDDEDVVIGALKSATAKGSADEATTLELPTCETCGATEWELVAQAEGLISRSISAAGVGAPRYDAQMAEGYWRATCACGASWSSQDDDVDSQLFFLLLSTIPRSVAS